MTLANAEDEEGKVEDAEDKDKKKTKKVKEVEHEWDLLNKQKPICILWVSPLCLQDACPRGGDPGGVRLLLQVFDQRLGGPPGREALRCGGPAGVQLYYVCLLPFPPEDRGAWLPSAQPSLQSAPVFSQLLQGSPCVLQPHQREMQENS
eukprot:scaffold321475_cov17-Tisochrysis_lutea.AAC.2